MERKKRDKEHRQSSGLRHRQYNKTEKIYKKEDTIQHCSKLHSIDSYQKWKNAKKPCETTQQTWVKENTKVLNEDWAPKTNRKKTKEHKKTC